MKHQETHPEFVEGCFGCKVSSIAIQKDKIKRVAHK